MSHNFFTQGLFKEAFTGVADVHGVHVHEGDRVRLGKDGPTGIIKYSPGLFYFEHDNPTPGGMATRDRWFDDAVYNLSRCEVCKKVRTPKIVTTTDDDTVMVNGFYDGDDCDFYPVIMGKDNDADLLRAAQSGCLIGVSEESEGGITFYAIGQEHADRLASLLNVMAVRQRIREAGDRVDMTNFLGHHSYKQEADKLIGRIITGVRYTAPGDLLGSAAWQARGPVLILDDGKAVYVTSDNEGEQAGSLSGYVSLPICPEEQEVASATPSHEIVVGQRYLFQRRADLVLPMTRNDPIEVTVTKELSEERFAVIGEYEDHGTRRQWGTKAFSDELSPLPAQSSYHGTKVHNQVQELGRKMNEQLKKGNQ